MTAITYDGATPTVGADADTWGSELNTGALAKIKVDLDMLNTTTANTILGRNEGTTGEVERLSVTEATAMLNAVVGDSGSGGTKGLVPAPATGDAAAGKVLTAAGTWGYEVDAVGTFTGATGATLKARGLSCARDGAGEYTFTLDPAMPDANYAVVITPRDAAWLNWRVTGATKNTTTFSVVVQTTAAVAYDPTELAVMVYG